MERPFWNGEECVACPEELPNLNRTSGMCALACPADKPYWNDFECLDCRTAYPLGDLPFWDPILESCVDSCPLGTSADGGSTCQTCADVHGDAPPLWDPESRTCVAECNGIPRNGYCLPCDASEKFLAPYWDAAAGKCTTCPDELLWDPNTRKCTKECSTEKHPYYAVCMLCKYVTDANRPAWGESGCTACPEDKPNWSTLLYRCEPPCSSSQTWTG